MIDIVDELKSHARALHRAVRRGDDAARRRLTRLRELRSLPDEELRTAVRRRHCLSVVACELGFGGWSHLTALLRGDSPDDFGTLLHRPACDVHWNVWSASYPEAREIHRVRGGYLLAWRQHYLVTDRHYVRTLGLDPDDADWERIAHDWVRPADAHARARLYARLIDTRLVDGA